MPLNTLRLHSRQYICSDFVFLALCRTSRVVVRAFHRASSEKSFPPSPSLCLADKCAAAVNLFICIPLLLARSPATTTAAVVQCLTTDSPVTQKQLSSFSFVHAPQSNLYPVCVLSHSSADTPRSLLLTTFRLRFSGALSNISSSYLYCSLARSTTAVVNRRSYDRLCRQELTYWAPS